MNKYQYVFALTSVFVSSFVFVFVFSFVFVAVVVVIEVEPQFRIASFSAEISVRKCCPSLRPFLSGS